MSGNLAVSAINGVDISVSPVLNETQLKGALNASGSAPIYACRAWVNFNGTDTVAIRASGNVSSITDNGVGAYTVNFTTAMPDVNYSVGGITTNTDQNEINYPSIKALNSGYLTSSFTFFLNFHVTNLAYISKDHDRIMLSFFR